ncbi:RHS repeat-associated core domain-containing protein, partial [Dissulfurirhabdus thermomarina]
WHRYYDPSTGRYLSPDPIGLAGGINLYSYANANPINLIDRFGLVWVTIGYDYHGVKNWARWYLNRWGSQIGKGLDPTFPGADPEELVGLKRDVLQEWRPDPDDPCRDKEFPIGTRRRVPQDYNKFLNPGPDKVLVNKPDEPYYYQWDPWVSSPTYDDYPNTKYENLYYWEQGE